jgi:hypothetical protein
MSLDHVDGNRYCRHMERQEKGGVGLKTERDGCSRQKGGESKISSIGRRVCARLLGERRVSDC